ncbi:type II toxin-antitoxin system VapB family antitoxin [Streptomyces sp. URMC 123]|uniref:type II toxin-antitoxin system VapB family antitoxin n=1 Tax=Streptomyces sp. URMC 123 TaxID=3423403 RepID=UPI003F1B97DC
MARTVIDLNDEMLAEAAKIFGTTTKVATVNAALEDAVRRRRRQRFFAWLDEGGLPDLDAPAAAPAPDGPGTSDRPRASDGPGASA